MLGIGACSRALEKLGIEHEIVDTVEIDKFAVKSFNAIHGTNFDVQDITEWDKDIEVDLITHGSPCQDFSVSGLQAGGDEGSGTRSSLMYESIRIINKLRPKYVLWENVKNLLSKKHIHNFNAYLEAMERLGYKSYYQVLNAKDYGIPQNRKRVYTISIRKDIDKGNFIFPEKQELKLKLKDMLEDEVDEKYYIKKMLNIIETKKYIQYSNSGKMQNSQAERVYYLENDCMCTISSSNTNGDKAQILLDKQKNIARKLTAKECWRLMGFDDEDFEKAEKVNSNAQLYKQAGNSIVVDVLEKILNNLLGEK